MKKKPDKVAAVIVAAGEGKRMEGIDKVLVTLAGEPLLLWATRAFQQCPAVDQIVVVVSGEREQQCRTLVAGPDWSKVTDICLGGDRRQDSVAAGLKRLREFDWVVIHDGARPLVTVDLIERGLEAARETGAAAAAVPVTDTIKVVDAGGIARQTLPRQNLRAIQTPQVFRFDIVQIAHYQDADDVTDDASLVERQGHRVKLYMGSYENIKVTTPADLALAEIILRKRES
jgi:2-C-methyl-D-erythritol 4-phosphate cytidylyltransferase